MIKSHGGADAIGTARAIEIGYEMVKDQLLSKIQETLAGRAGARTVPPAASLSS